jgi:dTDP-4-dehydrorhamnose 3,5-epimerase
MSASFEILDTPLAGVKVLKRTPMGDARGYLERMYCSAALEPLLSGKSIVQINHTLTESRGTVRGLHFQYPPHAEIKLVSCLRGAVFDVAVDLRRGSSTFLRWHAEVLDAGNHRTLLIPEGFAHGFQTLSDGCELLYLHTAAYQPTSEGGVSARDPLLAIQWPEAITQLSPRDARHEPLTGDFSGISL